jgi:alkylated DNA repair dioxygenase AlkB
MASPTPCLFAARATRTVSAVFSSCLASRGSTGDLRLRGIELDGSARDRNDSQAPMARPLLVARGEYMQKLIQGLEIHKGAISSANLGSLVEQIDAEGRWEPDYGRKTQRHGWGYDHKRHLIYELLPFPAWLQELASFAQQREWMRTSSDQASVQWYSQKSYINGHIDDPKCFREDIATISLVSSALYWLTDGTCASAHIVGPGDVVVLRGPV